MSKYGGLDNGGSDNQGSDYRGCIVSLFLSRRGNLNHCMNIKLKPFKRPKKVSQIGKEDCLYQTGHILVSSIIGICLDSYKVR